jgi:hypothetical protein
VAVGAKKVSLKNSYKHAAAANASTMIPMVANVLEESPIGEVYAEICTKFTDSPEKNPIFGKIAVLRRPKTEIGAALPAPVLKLHVFNSLSIIF